MSQDPEWYPPATAESIAELDRQATAARKADSEREAQETTDLIERISARARDEALAWQSKPCGGELALVTKCGDADAETCDRRNHRMCPRNRLQYEADQEAERKRQKRRDLITAGVPVAVIRAVFDSEPFDTPAVRQLSDAMASLLLPTIVVLQGGVGCGKTCAAVRWLLGQGGLFVGAAALQAVDKYTDESRRYMTTPALVLDDIGVEYMDKKGFLFSYLDGLLTARHAAELPTVITTNLSAEVFKERYGERIADRIRGNGRFIKVSGTSLRRK